MKKNPDLGMFFLRAFLAQRYVIFEHILILLYFKKINYLNNINYFKLPLFVIYLFND